MVSAQVGMTHKDRLLAKKSAYLMPCIYNFYRDPVWVARAEMQYLFDERDKQYLDCFAGVGVVNCGHCNPDIQGPAFEAARRLDHTTTVYLSEPMIDLAERLARLTPGALTKSFFCSSGSEANEGAALVAMLASGRRRFAAFDLGLHGRTLLTMSLTGLPMWRTDTSLAERVVHLPTPNCFRCPYGKEFPACELHCAREAAKRLEEADPEQIAGFIAEPILGNGGIIPLPEGYLEILCPALKVHGIVFIVDEMQTGFGRTGKWFGIERHNVEPDVMSIAKALGNGVPVGAFIATDEVAAAYAKPGASTFGGNGISMGAAHATLDFIEANHLPDRAARMGEWFIEGLSEMAREHSRVGDVRGRGLMIGVEIIDAAGAEDAEATERILESMKERGFLIGKTGAARNVLTFMPPLIVEKRDLEDLIENLEQVLRAMDEGP